MALPNNTQLILPLGGVSGLFKNPKAVEQVVARVNLLSNPKVEIVTVASSGGGSKLVVAEANCQLMLALRFSSVVTPLGATPTAGQISTAFNQLIARLAEVGMNT